MRMLYVIWDKKANDVIGTPFGVFVYAAEGAAVRHFAELVNDERSMVFKHPEDFELRVLAKSLDGAVSLESLLDLSDLVITATSVVAASNREMPSNA